MRHNIENLYKYNTHVSFEVFPPKTAIGLKQVYRTIADLKTLEPDFFSVTYGAGGSTAEKSLEIASAITNLAQVNCVAHFTCVGMNQEQVKKLLESLENHGITNVLALRGDPPEGEKNFKAVEGGFQYASELVHFIREHSNAGILVAGYPEGHTENPSREDDFQNLLVKVNAGADGIVTQACFDNPYLFEFAENLDRNGVTIPLIAGIFLISNAKQMVRIIELSGASIPDKLKKGLEKYGDSQEDMLKFGTDFVIQQVDELIQKGILNFHFYIMNRSQQIRDILTPLKSYFPRLNFIR